MTRRPTSARPNPPRPSSERAVGRLTVHRSLVQERRPAWVVLQCEAITDIDVTAADMLERLDNELDGKGAHLAFVELRTRLRDLVHDYGLPHTIDRKHFYASIDEALRSIGSTHGDERSAP